MCLVRSCCVWCNLWFVACDCLVYVACCEWLVICCCCVIVCCLLVFVDGFMLCFFDVRCWCLLMVCQS